MRRLPLRLTFALALPVALGSAAATVDDPPITRNAICRWAVQPPKIDGKLNETVWESAQVIENFPSFWSKTDNGKGTRARMLWNSDALYIGVTMTDKELRSFGEKHNDYLWNGDVFEMFFKPSADKPAYYEFQVNPKSVLLEVPFPERGADVGAFSKIKPLGMSAVAKVEGTLNQPGDVDTGWSVEIEIPWTAFESTGGRPASSAKWLFAFCRYDYGPEGTKPVLMSSAPLTQPNFHRLEDYGTVRFDPPTD